MWSTDNNLVVVVVVFGAYESMRICDVGLIFIFHIHSSCIFTHFVLSLPPAFMYHYVFYLPFHLLDMFFFMMFLLWICCKFECVFDTHGG